MVYVKIKLTSKEMWDHLSDEKKKYPIPLYVGWSTLIHNKNTVVQLTCCSLPICRILPNSYLYPSTVHSERRPPRNCIASMAPEY